MKEYLEFRDYDSHKFWQIEVAGNEFTVVYGKFGTDGRTQTKSFKDAAEALKEAQKVMKQKIKKGYEKMLEASPTEYKIGDKVDASKAYKFFQDYDAEFGTALDQIKSFITQENCDKVTKIVIGMWGEDTEDSPEEIINFIIENKEKFKAVKHFYFGDIESEENEISWIEQADYENFLKEFNTIEKLEFRGGNNLSIGKVNLPNLKMLRIETGGMDNALVAEISASKANMPNLEFLELWLGDVNYGGDVEIETIKELISGDSFPKLKHLGIMNSDTQNDVVKLFENHPILDRLDVLDLSMGILTKIGGESLLANDKLSSLKSLNCVFNFMPDDMIKALTKKFPNGDFDRSGADYDMEEDYWYVEVGE